MGSITKPTIAFLGAGNMATSLINGLHEDAYPSQSIIATRRDERALQDLSAKFGIRTTTDNQKAVQQADVIVLCVKPVAMQVLCADIKTSIQEHKPVVISIAAGITLSALSDWLGDSISIVRCMPNTPAFIRCGVSALHANLHTTEAQRDMAEHIARTTGMAFWINDEEQLHAITVLSGSGPAYFYVLMEHLIQIAIKAGLPHQMAEAMILQTALGAAKMALASDLNVPQLRQQVTSPGGTTESALRVLSQHQFEHIIETAVTAALDRSKELAKQPINKT